MDNSANSEGTDEEYDATSGPSNFGKLLKKFRKSGSSDISRIHYWSSSKEFLLMSIGLHAPILYLRPYVSKDDITNENLVQLFIAYLVVGIPAGYIQMVIGQYTKVGYFFLGRMLPLARGIIFIVCMCFFVTSVIYVILMQTYLIYALISLHPSGLPWMKCSDKYSKHCWQLDQGCPKRHCLKEDQIFLAAYMYWNITFMNGTYPPERAKLASSTPDLSKLWALATSWAFIFLLIIIRFMKLKKICKIFILVLITAKVFLTLSFFIEGITKQILLEVVCMKQSDFSNFKPWKNAVRTVVQSMGIADLTTIMFGVFTKSNSKGGSLIFFSGLLNFFLVFFDIMLIATSTARAMSKLKLDSSEKYLLFMPTTAEFGVGIVPSALGELKTAPLWALIYFSVTYVRLLLKIVITIMVMQKALYQRYPLLENYNNYILPMFCILGFSVGCIFQSKEAYEIYYDLRQGVCDMCGMLTTFLLSTLVIYVYGIKRFSEDIQFMTGKRPTKFWKITWFFLPIILMMCVPYEYLTQDSLFYKYRLTLMSILYLPYIIICFVDIVRKIAKRNVYGLFKPDPTWGPIDESQMRLRRKFHPKHDTRIQSKVYTCRHKCILNNKDLANERNREKNLRVLEFRDRSTSFRRYFTYTTQATNDYSTGLEQSTST